MPIAPAIKISECDDINHEQHCTVEFSIVLENSSPIVIDGGEELICILVEGTRINYIRDMGDEYIFKVTL